MNSNLGLVIRCVAIMVFFIFGMTSAMADSQSKELEMAISYRFVPEPVNTDQILKLDPELLNPHHSRWVLQRKIELKGLNIRKLGQGRYGVEVQGIESSALGYIRGEGPWYRSLKEFPCSKDPDDRFATEEGSRQAVDLAGQKWAELIKSKASLMSLKLSKVSAYAPELALKKGLQIYRYWLRDLEKEWLQISRISIRSFEWSFYQKQAHRQSMCHSKIASRGSLYRPTPWSAMMETPPLTEPDQGWEKPLVRAPARRWNGMFSVRLDVEIGSRILNGQFLIDSDTPRSVLSPAWLNGEGILPALIQNPGLPLENVSVMGESGMAFVGSVDRVSMSGLDLDIEDFLLYNTDFFLPPETRSSCCDGVLGVDFLKKYVVQFNPGKVDEILIWSREKFRPVTRIETERSKTGNEFVNPVWIETHMNSKGKLVSDDCRFTADRSSFAKTIHWDTGNDAALEALPETTPSAGTVGNLECDKKKLAQNVQVDRVSTESVGNWGYSMVGGIAFLARGPFTFDLPHGRIWFSKTTLDAPILKNQSGLHLKYFREDGDRVLRVVEIEPSSHATALIRQGMRVGTRILRVDFQPASEMNIWDVERRLAGAFGDSVTLEWPAKKGRELKVVPLKVR